MLRISLVSCLAVFLFAPSVFAQSSLQQMEDVLYLKDGSIVRGVVIEQIPGESLKIRTQGGSVFVYTMDEITKMTKEPLMGIGPSMGTKKEPWLAFGLSFLIPGAGQFYNGQHSKGVVQLGAVVLGWGLMISAVEDNYEVYGDMYDPDDDDGSAGLGVLLWLGGTLWSWIDAPISANRINRENQQSNYGHLMEFDVDRTTLGVDAVVHPNRVDTRVTLHF